MIGAVKSYDRRRGLGLLVRDDGGADVAVYASELERAGMAHLAEGKRLRFDIRTDRALGRSFAVNLEEV